jgi:serine O-acetyltransferase
VSQRRKIGANFLDSVAPDLERYVYEPSWVSLLSALRKYRTIRPIVSLRFAQSARNRWAARLLRGMHRWVQHHAGMDLPGETTVGPGIAITHGWGLVVSPDTVIGSNVTIFHGVTLGKRSHTLANGETVNGAPTIEDDVWIGPNAVIIGPITIGAGSIIAPLTMVLEDIPPHSLVVGNPARIAKSNIAGDIPNRSARADKQQTDKQQTDQRHADQLSATSATAAPVVPTSVE